MCCNLLATNSFVELAGHDAHRVTVLVGLSSSQHLRINGGLGLPVRVLHSKA